MIAAANSKICLSLAHVLLVLLCQGCTSVSNPEIRDGDPTSGTNLQRPSHPSEQDTERGKAIQAYREHLARFPDSPDYDAVKRRLADLLLESASESRVVGLGSGSGQDLPGATADASYNEAIAAYEYLLERSPGDSELLYQLSRAYEESGQSRQALDAVDRLLRQPADQAPWLHSDTLFRQGELLFDADQFPRAEMAYGAVVALGEEAPAYQQSLYKLGWSRYMQGKYAEALDPFFAYLETLPIPVSDGALSTDGLSAVESEQLTELLDVVSSCLVQLGGIEAADDFFAAGESRSYERDIYLALATWYERQLQVSKAGETLLIIAQRAPLASDAPTLTARALTLYQTAGFERLTLETRLRFADMYGPRSDFWLQHETGNYPEEFRLMDESLRKLGSYYHQRSRELPLRGYAQLAERYYRDYLSWFAGTGSAGRVQVRLAELLAEKGRYAEAYDYYRGLVQNGSDETLAAAAALAAIQINIKLVLEADPETEPPLSRRARDDEVQFVVTFPNHDAAPRILARVGSDLLDENSPETLQEILQHIFKIDPAPDELMLIAWTLQARAAQSVADMPGAVEAYRAALDHVPDVDERRSALTEGLAAALLDTGKQQFEKDQWEAAASRFEEAARLASADQLRQSAHYAEASVYLAQQQWDRAIHLLQAYRRQYPDGAQRDEVSRKLAYAHEQSGATALAAAEYYLLGQNERQPVELRRQAVLHSSGLYNKAGDISMAIRVREYYVEQFPEPADASVIVMEELASLNARRGDGDKRRHWLTAIIEAHDHGGSNDTRGVAARAALGLGELSLDSFRQVRLVSPLETNLSRKIRLMEQALANFERAVAYRVATVSSAAMFHMASMYDEMGRALLASERPHGLTGGERDEYETLLAEQAAPFTRQAMEMYDLNISRAPIDPPDPWVQRSVEQLDALRTVKAGMPGV
jgi:tetratricopeptide (TPR) repeat protein